MRKFLGILLIMIIIGVAGCSHDSDSNKSSSKKSENKTDVATKYSEEDSKKDQYKKLEKETKGLKQVPILDKLDPLMTEKTFTNKTGMQGWKDYKKLSDKVKLADLKYTEESEGSSLEEVDKFFKDKKGIKRKVMKDPDKDVKHIDYLYIDRHGKKIGNTDEPENYSQIMATFKKDKLIALSNQPGLFHMSPKDQIAKKDLIKVKELKDITKLKNPKAISYSIVQVKYKGKPYTDFSVLGNGSDSEKDAADAVLAYYLFSPVELDGKNHKVLNVSSAPFMSAQADFSTYQLEVFKKVAEEEEKYMSDN